MNHASVIELEFRERCRDDSYRWMKWTVRRDGDLYYAVGHDITLRKETIEALPSASRSRARSSTPPSIRIIVIDKNLKVVEASPSNDSTFAFSREETEGRGALDFVHPDDQGMILEVLERGFANDEVMQVRFRGLHTDGRWVMIEFGAERFVTPRQSDGCRHHLARHESLGRSRALRSESACSNAR